MAECLRAGDVEVRELSRLSGAIEEPIALVRQQASVACAEFRDVMSATWMGQIQHLSL